MSFVMAAPELMTAAATDLATIGAHIPAHERQNPRLHEPQTDASSKSRPSRADLFASVTTAESPSVRCVLG